MVENGLTPGDESADHLIRPQLTHAFLFFPFSFQLDKDKFSAFTKSGRWYRPSYEIDTGLEYNEYLYFYPYIRKILISLGDTPSEGTGFFRWKEGIDLQKTENEILHILRIYYHDDKKSPYWDMLLTDAFLHFYPNGVGVLVLELLSNLEKNANIPLPKHYQPPKSLPDYIRFFDLARRIYVSFVDGDYKFDCENGKIAAIKSGQCPISTEIMQINGNNSKVIVKHCFKEKGKPLPNLEESGFLSSVIKFFLDTEVNGNKFTYLPVINYDDYGYRPLIDDRMFVSAYYRMNNDTYSNSFIQDLKQYFENPGQAVNLGDTYNSTGFLEYWYKMMFLDGSGLTCQNSLMFRKLLNEATYTRWTRYSTFYGFTRYSAVTLVAPDNHEYVHNHFQTMYYQMALLNFFYRGSLLNFSRRSSDISREIHSGGSLKKLDRLYKDFLRFRNEYWFREVTAQEQGIEMFNLWMKQMNSVELMKDIEGEIGALYEYVNYRSDKNIQTVGAAALPIVIFAGILGMNIYNYCSNNKWWLAAWAATAVLTFLFAYNFFKIWRKNKQGLRKST